MSPGPAFIHRDQGCEPEFDSNELPDYVVHRMVFRRLVYRVSRILQLGQSHRDARGRQRTVDAHDVTGSVVGGGRCGIGADSHGTRRTSTEPVKSQTRPARAHGPPRPAAPAPPRASPPPSRPRTRTRTA